MTTVLRILLIVALQTAALGYMIYDRVALLSSPNVVTLKVKPVDPSDMFRGDYVILSYDISEIFTGNLGGEKQFIVGRPAYVTLEQKDGAWAPVAVNAAMPAHAPNQVVLRGDVTNAYATETSAPQTLRLTYGIESFFVPQGQGKAIEDERQKGDLDADIAVTAEGRAAIKSLRRADGQVMYVEGLF
jgi:uncharacterized membrane-anchored protein